MPWTATVTRTGRDPTNFNIVAEISFTDGQVTINDRIGSVDLTDVQVAEHCRKRIRNVLEVGDAALAALTTGSVEVPEAPEPDEKQKAQVALSQKLGVLELKKRVAAVAELDPTITADLEAVLKV